MALNVKKLFASDHPEVTYPTKVVEFSSSTDLDLKKDELKRKVDPKKYRRDREFETKIALKMVNIISF